MKENKQSHSIKIPKSVYNELLYFKRGNDTFGDVIIRLLNGYKDTQDPLGIPQSTSNPHTWEVTQ